MPRAVTPESTPNPNAIRFTLGEDLLGAESRTYQSARDASGTPWAARLFEINGIVGLFAVRDFVTVNKEPHTPWESIVPHVVEVLQSDGFGPA